MDRYAALADKFKKREKICALHCSLVLDPLIVAKMDAPDADFFLFDMEHGRYDAQNLVPIFHECRALGVPTVVRVQDALYHLVAKPVDMGADGVMIPRTETPEQLRAALRGLRFAPLGSKGCGGVAQFRPGESCEAFQRGRFLLPQIESPRGIENLPAMLDEFADDISAIIVGPYDMSFMVGTPLDIHSDAMTDAIWKVLETAQEYGKSCGVYCDNVDEARRYRAMGANVFWTGSDMQYLQMGVRATLDGLRNL